MNLKEIKIPAHTTVAEIMYRNARKYPQKEAVVFRDRRVTYQELDELSNQVANFIVAAGLRKGDKIALMVRNSERFPAVYFGILKAGAVAVSLNTSFLKPEVRYILSNCEARMFIFDGAFIETLDGIEKGGLPVEQFVCVSENPPPGTLGYFELMEKASPARPIVDVDESDLCSFLYTSGTTGNPKGAVFDHRRVVYNANVVGALNHRFNSATRSLIMMPLFHSAPLHNHFLGTSYVGGTNIILESFAPQLFLETIQTEKITHFFGPVVVYLTCIKLLDVKQYDLSSMEMFVMGGSPASPDDQARIIEEFDLNGRFMQVYGLTEGGPGGICLYPDDLERKPKSIGFQGSIGGNEIAIVDNDLNKIEKPGMVGEIAVFTESSMLEYYKEPEKTAATLVNGWVLTGDLGMYDEDGYVYFVDRTKDMIISGGQNIYSKEVEDVILRHPKVMEVAVIGIPHPDWGESVKAVVSPRPGMSITPEDIMQFCEDKIAKFKRPRFVQIVDAIRHNPAGKILKSELKKLYGEAGSKGLPQ